MERKNPCFRCYVGAIGECGLVGHGGCTYASESWHGDIEAFWVGEPECKCCKNYDLKNNICTKDNSEGYIDSICQHLNCENYERCSELEPNRSDFM